MLANIVGDFNNTQQNISALKYKNEHFPCLLLVTDQDVKQKPDFQAKQ